ncbi:MAG: aminotransferase class V-fold PLP-dependent enzyme [Candidatus Rifleibacteriota bacterium]
MIFKKDFSFSDIHKEEFREKFFPVTADSIYLNHAAIGPMTLYTSRAFQKYCQICSKKGEKHWEKTINIVEGTRARIADYIGCEINEVAFSKNVSEGLSMLANGIEWNSGDEILIADIEFPSNVYPWLNLEQKGVNVKYIKSEDGRVDLQQIKEAINKKTRLVSLSSVQFFSGYRANIDEIGKFLKKNNILFAVDSVQQFGAFPLNVENVDFMACAAHKWLMCGEGLGFVYCRKELAESLKQSVVGWQSVEDWTNFFKHELKLKPGATRFETGGMSIAGIYALNQSLKFIEQIGLKNISDHILELSNLTRQLARERDYALATGINEPLAENCSGITSFAIINHDENYLAGQLEKKDIIVSAREGHLRISPTFYNNQHEIYCLFNSLDEITDKI